MNKWEGLMGLCVRAGKARLGADAALKCVRSGGAKLALVDEAASGNTAKALRDACLYRPTPLRETPAGALGHCTGREGRMAAAVTDEGFAEAILSLIDKEHTD